MAAQLRKIRVHGKIAYVPLTRGYEAIIDAADVPLVDGWNWSSLITRRADGSIRAVYAVRTAQFDGKPRTILMHRVVGETPDHLFTDHVDGDGLNNRRTNLRPATNSQNGRNRRIGTDNKSGFKGVFWSADIQKWRAEIYLSGERKRLGSFTSLEDAALAYAKASKELHGEFGRTA